MFPLVWLAAALLDSTPRPHAAPRHAADTTRCADGLPKLAPPKGVAPSLAPPPCAPWHDLTLFQQRYQPPPIVRPDTIRVATDTARRP